MSETPLFMRDVFINELYEAAKDDKDIFLISADFGAPALDRYREELPDQFIHSGISEQHMIDMAAGLSLSGKKVYAYSMAPFIALRCYEQIKCALAMMDQPVTVLGVGVGLGYANSGPTHYVTEDVACLRALNGIEVLTLADEVSTSEIAKLTLKDQAFRYIRLDRDALPVLYGSNFSESISKGFIEHHKGERVCLISSGFILHRVLEAQKILCDKGQNPGVVDLFRCKPINYDFVDEVLRKYDSFVTVEEQCLSGGFGSAVLEFMADNNIVKPIKRLGLPDRYYFENLGRKGLHDAFNLSIDDICNAVSKVTQ